MSWLELCLLSVVLMDSTIDWDDDGDGNISFEQHAEGWDIFHSEADQRGWVKNDLCLGPI